MTPRVLENLSTPAHSAVLQLIQEGITLYGQYMEKKDVVEWGTYGRGKKTLKKGERTVGTYQRVKKPR